ncbi:MAG: FAD-dependent oxidoreductase, partial [Pseudobdellovibrionaceae bacterium]
GEEITALVAKSHQEAIKEFERIVLEEGIDCDFAKVNSYLFTETFESPEKLSLELEVLHRAHIHEVHMLPHAPFEEYETGACLVFPEQVQLHPMKFVQGMVKYLIENGVKIFCDTSVTKIKEENQRVEITTHEGHKVRAQNAIIATNTPVNNLVAIHTKQAAYRTYVVGFRVPRGTFSQSFFWDTKNPYHYIRLQHLDEGSDLLLVGGADHKTGQNKISAEVFANIEQWARARFKSLQEVLYTWSGQVMQSNDGLAFLGKNPGNDLVYVITGDSGNGFTNAMIGSMIITDQAQNFSNSLIDVYSPSRVTLGAINTFLKENFNTTVQYADWIQYKSENALEDLKPGEGEVINNGFEKIAVFRDETGHLKMRSAVCTHLGGIVRWNGAEKSWDCPCHGSRFNMNGEVIEGPANKNLGAIKKEKQIAIETLHSSKSSDLNKVF